jgi:uncharacterized protein
VTKIDKFRQTLFKHKNELRREYSVKTIGLFGSYVRGEQKKKSDLDVLVEFSKPIGLLKFGALEDYLSGLTGVKVDLVMEGALKPGIGRYILREAVYL